MTETEFTAIYNDTFRKVLSGIMRIVQNEAVAEELLQDTYLQFLRVTEREKISWSHGLLFRISHNLAVDYIRKNARVESREIMESTSDKNHARDEMEYRLLRGAIVERLEKENARLLKFYIMTVDYAMHIDAVAGELGISRRSAFRLRDQLKAILGEFL